MSIPVVAEDFWCGSLSTDNAAVSQDTDLVRATFVLAILVFVVSLAAVVVARRWRGLDDVDRTGWSPQQVKADRHWRLFLCPLLIASWTCMAVALTDRAPEPGIATSLRATIGPVPIPKWFAVAVHPRFDYHGVFGLLWENRHELRRIRREFVGYHRRPAWVLQAA
jgi:hypothetical protein